MNLNDLLNSEPAPLNPVPPALKRPRVTFSKDGIPETIVTGDAPEAHTQEEYLDIVRSQCKVEIPSTHELVLVEFWYNESAWTRKDADQELAVTRPVGRYRFKVERKSKLEERKSLAEMDAWILEQDPRQWYYRHVGEHAEIVALADLQIGKVDERGGTEELQKRFYLAIEQVALRIVQSQPRTIVIGELGDGCENFENTPTQAHTNDRNLVAQLDLHQEFLFHAIRTLAPLAPEVIVVGVPSNHMEVRKDGKAVGGPDNDYGLLSLSSLKRSFSLNPEAFGHVQFFWPDPHEVSIVLPVAGKNVGFTHGHYTKGAGAADNVPKWLANQFAARISHMDEADIIITGHFHHLRLMQIIGGRWWFQGPALDNGSAWLKRINGQGSSDAGILCLRIDPTGWSDIQILGNIHPA